MRFYTGNLFLSLIRAMKADCACDVGSMDGREALRFRRALPAADVYAFEANPINFSALSVDPRIAAANIVPVAAAVNDANGVADFHVARADYGDPAANRGLSSLMQGQAGIRETLRVPCVRLDDFLDAKKRYAGIGLWIDAEGAAFQALSGAARVADRVCAVHAEVEEREFFRGQKLGREVAALLGSMGFRPAASEFWLHGGQGNVLFVRKDAPAGLLFRCRLRARLVTIGLLAFSPFRRAFRALAGPSLYERLKRLYHRRLL